MRTFFGLSLPESTRIQLAKIQRQIKESLSDDHRASLRWVEPVNFHLTLRFLGETEPSHAQAMAPIVAKGLAQTTPFQLSLGRLGCFPKWSQMKVLWVGLQGDVNALGEVQALCEEAARAAGLPPEDRPYHPHLTLAYMRRSTSRAQIRAIGLGLAGWPKLTTDQSWPVKRVTLFESRAARRGRVYVSLAKWGVGTEEGG